MPHKTAKLALADGTVFTGSAFGYTDAPQPIGGEVVFNTSMTGYQEILTDPSYAGQIVTMTYPLIGNYGIAEDDMESTAVHPRGFVVRELANIPSNFRAAHRLEDWLNKNKVLAIADIDTRALTRRLRSVGVMNGVISTSLLDDEQLINLAQSQPSMAGQNLAQTVSPTDTCGFADNLGSWQPLHGEVDFSDADFKVIALDCGAKHNILRHLVQRGCAVEVVPHDTPADQILAAKPDGLFVSNGPGDPEPVQQTVDTLKQLHDKLPIFGICLGHQLLALSLGAKTYKLPFGHRGANHPIQNLGTKKVEITSHNHGFAVDIPSLQAAGGVPTHINLNDNTLAGFRHTSLPIFSVQYHPEASPGPHDSAYLFDCFIEMMRTNQPPSAEQMHEAQTRRNKLSHV